LAENGIDCTGNGSDPFLPPTPTVDVLRHVDIGMPHIVARDFWTSTGTQHQTAMHCPETPEVNTFRQTQLHCSDFDLPVEQIMLDGLARAVGKNQIFRWAGKFRTRERNLGIAFYEIPVAMRQLLDDTKAWIEYKTYPPDEIAVRFHHRLVQTHPFPSGNGRHARLMADLLVMRLGGERFSWGSANLQDAGAVRQPYIAALQAADDHDIGPLLAFGALVDSPADAVRRHHYQQHCHHRDEHHDDHCHSHQQQHHHQQRHQHTRCPSPRRLLNGSRWITCLEGSESASSWT
jgi:Fic-DOC domain mobile mystery protein B